MHNHKSWLDNEYRQWTRALQSSTVHNFKEHPQVRRMLSIGTEFPFSVMGGLTPETVSLISLIDSIGYSHAVDPRLISGNCARMVWYARQILNRKPSNIIEIGGGSGQFYAVLRALGYASSYYIADLPEVQAFQHRYLEEVSRRTDLYLEQSYMKNYKFCISLYALGEFDDLTKHQYIHNVVNKCKHGFIVWNPHSGASSLIGFKCKVQDEYPLLNPGNKQLEW